MAILMSPIAMLPALASSAGTQENAALMVQPTSTTETRAIAFRKLQSELMVATLSCNDKRLTAHYNTFVMRYRADLRKNAKILKALFRREHGARGQRMLDNFITGLANQASLDSMEDANFCAKALARFEALDHDTEGQTATVK